MTAPDGCERVLLLQRPIPPSRFGALALIVCYCDHRRYRSYRFIIPERLLRVWNPRRNFAQQDALCRGCALSTGDVPGLLKNLYG
jgi:hypothetical protein